MSKVIDNLENNNLLDQGNKDLLTKAGESESNSKEELLTQVTSIAQEEARTGQKIKMPSPEEMVARASSSLIVNQQRLNMICGKHGKDYGISRKGMTRVMNAIFALPQEGQKVLLQGKEEKAAFVVGQSIIRDMFIIMANHAHQEATKAKELSLQNTENSVNVENNNNEGGQ